MNRQNLLASLHKTVQHRQDSTSQQTVTHQALLDRQVRPLHCTTEDSDCIAVKHAVLCWCAHMELHVLKISTQVLTDHMTCQTMLQEL